MVDEVQSVIERWQSDKRLNSLGEAKVQQVIVLPILRRLGWDPDNDYEVYPQYPVEDKWVDYALLTDNKPEIDSKPEVFIEVKKGGEALEKHEEKLLMDYACRKGVKIAVLTNGATWWFYLPLKDVSWEQRKFHAIEFDKQNPAKIAQIFINLLSKENVSSGKAIENAEDLCKRYQIAESLPAAWDQLVKGKISDLLTTKTEELCGHRPSKTEVDQFLSKVRFPQITSHPSAPEPDPAPRPDSKPSGPVTGKKPTEFTFNGSRYEVTSWKNMLVRLCEIVHSAHRDRFEEVLSLKGRTIPPFSRDASGLAAPVEINNTGIFVEAHGAAQAIVKRAERLIIHFGYNKTDLSYEMQSL